MSDEPIEVTERGLVKSLQSLPVKHRRTRLLDLSDIKIGRPSKLTKAITQSIVDNLARGETLTSTAKLVGVDITTIYRWSDENETFRQALTRAHHHQAKALVDQSIELLDDNSGDVLESIKGPVINNAQVHRDKARVELRLRLAGIYNPMYAQHKDGTTVNVQVNTTVDAPKQETRDEWLARQRAAKPVTVAQAGGTLIEGGSK